MTFRILFRQLSCNLLILFLLCPDTSDDYIWSACVFNVVGHLWDRYALCTPFVRVFCVIFTVPQYLISLYLEGIHCWFDSPSGIIGAFSTSIFNAILIYVLFPQTVVTYDDAMNSSARHTIREMRFSHLR